MQFVASRHGLKHSSLDSSWSDIKALKFYVTNLKFSLKSDSVYTPHNSCFLVDFANEESTALTFEIPADFSPQFLSFTLGVDSATNTAGVMGGALDPTKGMYWTWQSGYINLKLETVDSQWHIGGYKFPYATAQDFKFNIKNNPLKIIIDVDALVSNIKELEKDHIMSPGADAMLVARYLKQVISSEP